MTATHHLTTCPVCAGATRVPAGDTPHKTITAGYDRATDTLACQNCGGQTMSLRATGKVRARPDGTPCTHEYQGRDAGRCLTRFTCRHCGDTYEIDSSD